MDRSLRGSQQAATHRHVLMPVAVRIAIFILVPLGFGALSVALGKDINWDLRNYHYYNAFAFIEHRMGFDIAPAQEQTFLNPLLDLPFYWLTLHFPPRAVGFLLGTLHGYNFTLVFLLFWRISTLARGWSKSVVAAAAATVSCIAPGFISELGNTMNDNLTSLFVLTAVLLIVDHLQTMEGRGEAASPRLVAAGFVLGLGVGLKLTLGVYALAAAIGVMLLQPSWRGRLQAVATCGGASMAGSLVTSGFWWWQLWSRYGNPFLPFYNNLFKSPFIAPWSFIDTRYLPSQLWEYVLWPIVLDVDSTRVNGISFFDIRLALLYVLVMLWLAVVVCRQLRRGPPVAARPGGDLFEYRSANFFIVFFGLSFGLWMLQSSIYRYLIPLELLVPLCFLIVLSRAIPRGKAQVVAALLAAAMTLVAFRPFSWGRISWGQKYFRVDTTAFDASDEALVVMLGWSPTAYVIPAFPPSYRFVRPESNFIQQDDFGFFQEIQQIVAQSRGSMYVLFDKNDPHVDLVESSQRLGIAIDPESCKMLRVNTPDVLEICRAAHTGPKP